jgi:hypothetical protein
MNIVHITENPIAGSPSNLNSAINKYTNHKSRLIAAHASNENRTFKSDLIIDNTDYDIIYNIIQNADIVHLHNFYKKQHLFRKYPELWPIVEKKTRVWQAHTQRNCHWVDFEEPLADKTMKHLVIAQYHTRQYPECTIVPNIIDIWDKKYMPLAGNHNTIPHVVYSPSNQNLSGWDDKGYSETRPVLMKLAVGGNMSHDIIINVPHEECMFRKSLGDIGIDEVKTGSYHLCSLENLSLGLATIAHIDRLTSAAISSITGTTEIPWISTPHHGLETAIFNLISNKDRLEKKKNESRLWMEKYWAPEVLVKKFTDIYESL